MPEAKPMQQLADTALMQMHTKHPGDLNPTAIFVGIETTLPVGLSGKI